MNRYPLRIRLGSGKALILSWEV